MENTEQQKKDEQFMRRALVEAEVARDEGDTRGRGCRGWRPHHCACA